MTVKTATLAGAAALIMIGSAMTAGGAGAASVDKQFNAAIARLLNGMKDGPVSKMSKTERKELIVCVTGVFGKLPDTKKKYIADAPSFDELRARFDKVGLENQARLKQQVRDECI